MSKMVEIIFDDGSKMFLETFDVGTCSGELVDPASGGKLLHKAKDFLDDKFQQIKLFSNGLAESIKGIDFQPDEFEVEFSVKFSADAGIIISSVSSEASITVKMKWNKAKGG
jgi:hypothetical protein